MGGVALKEADVSRATLGRIPAYLKYLKALPTHIKNISATAISKELGLGEVQVRKDLGAICGSGKPKIGYLTEELIQSLESFLCPRNGGTVIIGAGKLGRALLDYSVFSDYGLDVMAAFDIKVTEEELSASGNHFDKGEALTFNLVSESLLNGLSCILYVLHVVYCNSLDVVGSIQGRKKLCNLNWISLCLYISSVRGCLGYLARKGSWSHLSSGHAVDCIVDEDDGDILVPCCCMDSLSHTDAGQVSISLICKDDILRKGSLDSCGYSWCPAVGGFNHVAGKVVISHDSAPNWGYSYGLSLDTKLVDSLSHQTMDNSMGASWTVMELL